MKQEIVCQQNSDVLSCKDEENLIFNDILDIHIGEMHSQEVTETSGIKAYTSSTKKETQHTLIDIKCHICAFKTHNAKNTKN